MRLVVATAFASVASLVASTARADDETAWRLSADARVASALEISADAPSDRRIVVPYLSIAGGRDSGPVSYYATLRAGLPAYYGQIGLGLGVQLSLAATEPSTTRAGRSLFVALEAGGTGTFFDAPPEVQFEPDAVLYWGPYGRAELGTRLEWLAPTGQRYGVIASLGTEWTRAHYTAPTSGSGHRLGLDLGLGGELAF